jgi:hypothetical protein
LYAAKRTKVRPATAELLFVRGQIVRIHCRGRDEIPILVKIFINVVVPLVRRRVSRSMSSRSGIVGSFRLGTVVNSSS